MRLVRNEQDRKLIDKIRDARFITSADLYLLSDRSVQETSAALTRLRRSKHIPIVGSVGRVAPKSFYPTKTYVYGSGRRGHLAHWLAIGHLHGLFVEAARRLQVPIGWSQHRKHYRNVPDAKIELPGASWTLEVDNSTEGRSEGGIYGKSLAENTLIVAFKSEERFRNLCELPGLATWHGYFHDRERADYFNILRERVWWDGKTWVSLL